MPLSGSDFRMEMKKLNLMISLFLFLVLFTSCEERPDYSDEIYNVFWEAYRQRTAGAVIDGLMWSAISENFHTWEESVSYCENLTDLGYYDWRLPTVNELRTLIQNCPETETGGSCTMTDECVEENGIGSDYKPRCQNDDCRCKSMIESDYCKLGDIGKYWSSTEDTHYAVYVYFNNAYIGAERKTYHEYVRCVRNAE